MKNWIKWIKSYYLAADNNQQLTQCKTTINSNTSPLKIFPSLRYPILKRFNDFIRFQIPSVLHVAKVWRQVTRITGICVNILTSFRSFRCELKANDINIHSFRFEIDMNDTHDLSKNDKKTVHFPFSNAYLALA